MITISIFLYSALLLVILIILIILMMWNSKRDDPDDFSNFDESKRDDPDDFSNFDESKVFKPHRLTNLSGAPPKVLWTFWFGREMSDKRKAAFNTLNIGLKHIHITEDTIDQYLKWPVHPSVEYLSPIHKSDYYRIYFLYYYGGAYSDIKGYTDDWNKYWNEFDDPNTWMVGIPEIPGGVASQPSKDYSDEYQKLISNGFFIGRKANPFLYAVHAEQCRILSYYQTLLEENPSPVDKPRTKKGENGYPLRWAQILGEIMSHKSMEDNNYYHFQRPILFPEYTDYV